MNQGSDNRGNDPNINLLQQEEKIRKKEMTSYNKAGACSKEQSCTNPSKRAYKIQKYIQNKLHKNLYFHALQHIFNWDNIPYF